jgi:hypothetical protein
MTVACTVTSKETVLVWLSLLFLYKKQTSAFAFIKTKARLLLKVQNKLMFYFFHVLQAPFIKFKFSLIFFKVGINKNEVGVSTLLVREKRAEGRKSAGVRSISTFESSQRLHAGDLTQAY